MAHLVSLAAYSIKLWNETERDHEILSDFDGEGSDLLESLTTVLEHIKDNTLDQKELQQALSVLKIEQRGRIVSGIIETGQYGQESNIISVETKKTVYHRKVGDAEMWPFYFYIEIEEGVENGLLILQRTSAFGIRKVLHWVLSTALNEKYPEFHLRFRPLVDQTEIEKFVKGKIQKVSFVRMTIPQDVADSYDKGHQEVRGSMELVVRAQKGKALPMNNFLAKVFQANAPGGIFEIGDDEQFTYDNVKAVTKIGASTRTINAANPGRIRSYHDVTADIEFGTNGHPKYPSVHAEAQKLATRLRKVLFGEGA